MYDTIKLVTSLSYFKSAINYYLRAYAKFLLFSEKLQYYSLKV